MVNMILPMDFLMILII